jgi:hypothetical protein
MAAPLLVLSLIALNEFVSARSACGQSGTLVGVRQLLVAHSDFTDDIEIHPVGVEHEKFPHLNCWLKNNVGDVEIVGNHHLLGYRRVCDASK